MEESLEFLQNNIPKNSKIVVAVSGGPDSMCLLSLLCSLKKDKNYEIICAHVNHKIRIESDEEAIMVEKYCQDNNIIFELYEINEFINGKFSEEQARKKRYDFFRKILKKYNSKYLLTAHHGDDLIETILMRLTRGSTLSGYAGIRLISKNLEYQILRPLLYVDKNAILAYLEANNIPYAIDKSNASLKYTRNRYRHNILKELKKEEPNVHRKYLKFSNELQEYETFINNYIYDKGIIVDNYIVINKVLGEPSIIKRKSIELIIKDIQKYDILDINDKNMNDLISLLTKDNKSIDLNNNYQGINSYGKLFIKKVESDAFNELVIDKDIEINNFKFTYNSTDYDNTNYCICLDSSELKLPLKIRAKQDGDKMYVKNLKGSKKVKDIFIDSKIPAYKRDSYPILVDSDNKILWIPGIKKSQFSKDKDEKYDIIIKCEAR